MCGRHGNKRKGGMVEMVKRGRLALTLLVMVAITLLLSGCGKKQPTLYVYNWGDYIDMSILDEFEKETGRVVLTPLTTNEDMYVNQVRWRQAM